MQDLRLPRNVFLLIVLAAFAVCLRDYPLLPDLMASHFGVSGAANGWMTKSAFFAMYAAAVALAAIVGFALPSIIGRMPVSMINLPNKEYWLAPQRRGETLEFLKKHFAWYGCVVLLLEVVTIELAMQANLHARPAISSGFALFVIGAFTIFNVVWAVQIVRRFTKPAASA